MMKKYMIVFMLFVFGFGLGNAKFADLPMNTVPKLGKYEQRPVGEMFMLRPLLLGKTLRISLWIEEEEKGQFEKYSQMIKQGYQDWFDNALKQITASGRAEEFKDIIPYIKRPLSIAISRKTITADTRVSAENEDMIVLIYKTRKNFLASTYFKVSHKSAGVYNIDEKILATDQEEGSYAEQKYILTHEIGHSLGFADQYYPDNMNGDAVFASHSKKNIMNGEDQLSCDDADGFINAADRIIGLMSRGGEKGWKSLCPDSSEYYKRGMSTKTDRYRIYVNEAVHADILSIEEYENSRLISSKTFEMEDSPEIPFTFVDEVAVLKRDSQGYPSLMRGKKGEIVYLTGTYFKLERVVVKDDKFLSYLLFYPVVEGDRDTRKMEQFFKVNGMYGLLEGVFDIDGYRSATYTIEPRFAGEKATLTLDFVKKNGSDYQAKWQGPWDKILSTGKDKKDQALESALQRKNLEKSLYHWGTHWFEYMQSNAL